MIGLDSGLRLSKTNHKTHGLSPLRGMFTGCFDEKLRWNTTNRLGKPIVGAPVLRFMKALDPAGSGLRARRHLLRRWDSSASRLEMRSSKSRKKCWISAKVVVGSLL